MKRLRALAPWRSRTLPEVGKTPTDVVHRENKWTLLRYRGAPEGPRWQTPLVIVPSLINRHYVLDLLPERSFVAWLTQQGHDVFMIDWGTPADEDRYLSFDTVCDRYLGRALRVACRLAEQPQAHLMGYCLGGTLAAIHTAAHPQRVASLTALAAPIDFHDDGLLSTWTRTEAFDVQALSRATGLIPWPLLQATFHMLRPTGMLAKAVGLLDRWTDDEFVRGFMATERWGNDNVSFPGACFARYIQELYRDNALVRGSFSLSGRRVDLRRITCPVLAVTFEHDNIVPWRSATALLDHVGTDLTRRIHLPGGHVGAVVSRKAASSLWPQLSGWWAEHEAACSRAA